jgi:Spy/CpxP family protein refolding chaperone
VIGPAAKAKLLVFAVFLLGAVTGAIVERVYDTRRVDVDSTAEKRAERRTQQVQDYLDLSDDQRQQWKVIFEESRSEFDKLTEENRKLLAPNRLKWEELQDQVRSKIRGILTDEQKKQYEEFNESLRRQRQQPRPAPK